MAISERTEAQLMDLLIGPVRGRRFFQGFLTGVEILTDDGTQPGKSDAAGTSQTTLELDKAICTEEDRLEIGLNQAKSPEEAASYIDAIAWDEAARASLYHK